MCIRDRDLRSNTALCPRTGEICKNQCCGRVREESDPQWYSPSSMEELSVIYNANLSSKIKLLAGDTGRGV